MALSTESQVTLEVARFLVSGPSPEQIIAFHPSQKAIDHAYALIAADRNNTITDEERAELDSYVDLEYMMRLIKIEAQHVLRQRAS
jgi:hypothetical protein